MINFLNAALSDLPKLLQKVFNATDGHDHDGVNSKAVTAGTPAAGSLAASAGGRAIMANNYFDAATLTSKVADDALTNAVCDAKFAAKAFAADADSRVIFEDAIWTLAKLADTAKTDILSYQVEDLAAGVDIADRVIFAVPNIFDVTLISASIVSQGTAAGIDDSNKCVIRLHDGTNTIVQKEFDADPAFPATKTEVDLGALVAGEVELAKGSKLYLDVTNGTTANPPAFLLQVVYKKADAAA